MEVGVRGTMTVGEGGGLRSRSGWCLFSEESCGERAPRDYFIGNRTCDPMGEFGRVNNARVESCSLAAVILLRRLLVLFWAESQGLGQMGRNLDSWLVRLETRQEMAFYGKV